MGVIDLILRDVRVEDRSERCDVGIDGGDIVEVSPRILAGATQEAHLAGRLVLPGLINPHVHLDKAFVGNLASSGIMTEGVTQGASLKQSYTKDGVKARARRGIELAIRNGTTAIRTAADVDPILRTMCVEALLELKAEYTDRIAIQVLAFPQEGFLGVQGMTPLLEQALEIGADVLGGRPHGDAQPDAPKHISQILDMAIRAGKPVDMSVDAIFPPDPVDPTQLALPELARQTAARGLQGRVTAHHVLALSAVSRKAAEPACELVAKAGVNVTFNPISNLFTEGRTDAVNPRRGLTRVKDLWRAGVNLAFGTDNMDDTYLPYVNLDLLTEGLVASVGAHMGTQEERRALVRMMTHGAAKTLGIDGGYGLEPGCRADLVVLDTDSIDKVITERPRILAVLKSGRLTSGELGSDRRALEPSS